MTIAYKVSNSGAGPGRFAQARCPDGQLWPHGVSRTQPLLWPVPASPVAFCHETQLVTIGAHGSKTFHVTLVGGLLDGAADLGARARGDHDVRDRERQAAGHDHAARVIADHGRSPVGGHHRVERATLGGLDHHEQPALPGALRRRRPVLPGHRRPVQRDDTRRKHLRRHAPPPVQHREEAAVSDAFPARRASDRDGSTRRCTARPRSRTSAWAARPCLPASTTSTGTAKRCNSR